MTVPSDPGSGSAAAVPPIPFTPAGPLDDALLQALAEPALLVTGGGAIVAANAAAGALLGATPSALRGTPLVAHVADAPADVGRYLGACARTRGAVPGALRPTAAAAARRTTTGAVVRPACADAPALVLLRFRPADSASDRFVQLNRQLAELTREVRARRAAEGALTLAHERLQEQALELELANQQLHDQAVELEQQVEEAESLADELARANAELTAVVATAEEARTLAEQANRAKSEFLAVMSHELRTPLNAIGGYAELLELEIHGPLTAAQREDLARLRRSQRHLLALINEVLNFARLEAGQVQFRLAPVSVDELLRSLEVLIAPQLQRQGLRFTCEGCAPTLVAHADGERLRQVLLNLLSNAVKFTPPGGAVVVDADADAGHVRIHVRDTGIGIPADRLERVFEPFVQLDQRLTRAHEGVGLGLAISRDLVRGMGGELTVASEPGVGSTFTVTLPMA